jgi:hypothetical protein
MKRARMPVIMCIFSIRLNIPRKQNRTGFGGTLIVCPGVTLMALSGWSRSLVLRHAIRFSRQRSATLLLGQ